MKSENCNSSLCGRVHLIEYQEEIRDVKPESLMMLVEVTVRRTRRTSMIAKSEKVQTFVSVQINKKSIIQRYLNGEIRKNDIVKIQGFLLSVARPNIIKCSSCGEKEKIDAYGIFVNVSYLCVVKDKTMTEAEIEEFNDICFKAKVVSKPEFRNINGRVTCEFKVSLNPRIYSGKEGSSVVPVRANGAVAAEASLVLQEGSIIYIRGFIEGIREILIEKECKRCESEISTTLKNVYHFVAQRIEYCENCILPDKENVEAFSEKIKKIMDKKPDVLILRDGKAQVPVGAKIVYREFANGEDLTKEYIDSLTPELIDEITMHNEHFGEVN